MLYFETDYCGQSRISRTPYPPIGGTNAVTGAQNSSPATT